MAAEEEQRILCFDDIACKELHGPVVRQARALKFECLRDVHVSEKSRTTSLSSRRGGLTHSFRGRCIASHIANRCARIQKWRQIALVRKNSSPGSVAGHISIAPTLKWLARTFTPRVTEVGNDDWQTVRGSLDKLVLPRLQRERVHECR